MDLANATRAGGTAEDEEVEEGWKEEDDEVKEMGEEDGADADNNGDVFRPAMIWTTAWCSHGSRRSKTRETSTAMRVAFSSPPVLLPVATRALAKNDDTIQPS